MTPEEKYERLNAAVQSLIDEMTLMGEDPKLVYPNKPIDVAGLAYHIGETLYNALNDCEGDEYLYG